MKFSLIICSYNQKKEWLQNALSSAEGLFDEIIIVDDGSDIPVRGSTVRHNKNYGLYKAKNTGINLATGDIIAFLDDDDELIPEKVIEMKKFVETNESDVYSFHLQCFGETNSVYSGGENPKELGESNQFVGVSWFKRKLWEEIGGFTYKYAEDWAFWIKAHKANKKFVVFQDIFYKYRVRKGSVSRSWDSELTETIFKDMKLLYGE
jgi:GalNAc5-diNAcBac-PP-undecaprenol beta-1,3-glucosyltransferase